VRRVLALSPHLDDAAFSCGGTLARLARDGAEVTVCTAFTRSVLKPQGFALACQLDKGLPADVDYMAIRRAEDAEACARLGARPVWMEFAEAPHRGYADAKALFAPPRGDDGVVTPLAHALSALLEPAPDVILAPQAIGGHVDHVQLVRALRAVLRPSHQILWWADFPYAARPHTHPARPFETEMTALPIREMPADMNARLHACAAYATQLGFQFGDEAGLRSALAEAGAAERFRASAGATQLAA